MKAKIVVICAGGFVLAATAVVGAFGTYTAVAKAAAQEAVLKKPEVKYEMEGANKNTIKVQEWRDSNGNKCVMATTIDGGRSIALSCYKL